MDNDKEKKKVIISEITFWKKNHLLPEHYCDFLMQLYTEGKSLSEEGEKQLEKQSLLKKEKPSMGKIVMTTMTTLLILAIIALMFLFGENLVWLPISIGILVLIGIITFIIKTPLNKQLTTTLAYASGALLLFATSIRIVGEVTSNNVIALFITLIVNCIIWIVLGGVLKQVYFMISGILGLIIIVFYTFFK